MIVYIPVYRMGGTANFKWKEAIGSEVFEEALGAKKEIERIGYPCLIRTQDELNEKGLPSEYTPKIEVELFNFEVAKAITLQRKPILFVFKEENSILSWRLVYQDWGKPDRVYEDSGTLWYFASKVKEAGIGVVIATMGSDTKRLELKETIDSLVNPVRPDVI
jgi:hypothetical protein